MLEKGQSASASIEEEFMRRIKVNQYAHQQKWKR